MADRPYTDADLERLATLLHSGLCGWNCPGHGILEERKRNEYRTVTRAALDSLVAAGRLLPEPTETRVEWGVWWHAGNPDGICLDSCHLTSEDEARLVGTSRLGELGIDSYTVVRREHRCYPDGWFVPHWTRHSGPHTKGEDCG